AIQYAQTASGGTRNTNANATSVMVLRNGQPVRVPIQTGISDGTNTQVTGGLQVGDEVVTGITSGSSSTRTSSGSGNIFGFGAPGGGNNNNANRQTGQTGQTTGQTGQNAQRTGTQGGAAPAGGAPASGPAGAP